jgi:glycosyltransferase involved in cell wall biosynthesis
MERRLRVVHVVDSMKLGGVQTLLLSVLPRLADLDIDCTLAVLHGPGPFSNAFSERGISPVHLAASRWDPRIPLKLRGLLRAEAPDIVHAHGAPSCLFSERARPARLVEHLHHIRGGGGLRQRVMERFLYRKCHVLLACSRAVARSVSTPVETRILYNGIDSSRFRPPDAAERAESRKFFGIASDDFVLGMTGRITVNKGQRRVCEALQTCRDRYPQLRLLLAGSGPEEATLKAWCVEHGLNDRVYFAGFQEDVLPVLHALDAYVMASEAEGFPVALLEAMGTGLPCLVSDFSAAREIVVDGENGLMFQRGDTRHLVEAIADCVESPHKRLEWGAVARETVVQGFTLDQTVALFAATYHSLI